MVVTFKIITLASSIEEGTVDLFKDTFTDSGAISVDGGTLHCWKRGGHGTQTYLEVVENSCNPGFVSLGNKLGIEKLMSYIKNFGFGSKTGIDLNGEGNGILFKEEKMGPLELATTAFGQGISVTPIQQITAVSAVINGGILYTPYVVMNTTDEVSKTIVFENKPKEKRRVISPETSATARFALESVVAMEQVKMLTLNITVLVVKLERRKKLKMANIWLVIIPFLLLAFCPQMILK